MNCDFIEHPKDFFLFQSSTYKKCNVVKLKIALLFMKMF